MIWPVILFRLALKGSKGGRGYLIAIDKGVYICLSWKSKNQLQYQSKNQLQYQYRNQLQYQSKNQLQYQSKNHLQNQSKNQILISLLQEGDTTEATICAINTIPFVGNAMTTAKRVNDAKEAKEAGGEEGGVCWEGGGGLKKANHEKA